MNSDPDVSPARPHIERAQSLLRARDRAGARAAAETALTLAIGDAVERNALGSVLYELGELDRARELFQGVLAELPHYGDALNNLGNVLAREGNPRAALEFYGRALAADANNPDYLANLGGVRQALGDVQGALAVFERALMLDPSHADARWNRALARLLSGDFTGGFADYEVRWRLPEFGARRFPEIQWQGGSLHGLTLLLHSEQGFGDTIQMIRFAPRLRRQGARVVVETHEPLVRLIETAAGVDAVHVRGAALPPFDLHLPIMSLPHLLQVAGEDDVAPDGPYLGTRAGAAVALPAPTPGVLRVGIVWAGRPTHKHDRARSLALDTLAPLAQLPGVQLFSLQVGERARDLAQVPWGGAVGDLAPQLADFAATASAVAALDLVISVDTAVAHLAGALGKACWVLLPFAPDWRWLVGRADSPWYPSLRLFRQAKVGDWRELIGRVAAALAAALEKRAED